MCNKCFSCGFSSGKTNPLLSFVKENKKVVYICFNCIVFEIGAQITNVLAVEEVAELIKDKLYLQDREEKVFEDLGE